MKYENIEAERARLGMSKQELADRLGVSRKTYFNWQKGKSEISVSKLNNLCDLFCVTADYLLGRTNKTA